MKKTVSFDKKIEFPTMIGEISAISLEKDLSFVDESNISGDLLLQGRYKLTEASRLEEDFQYHIPIEIALSEVLDLDTSSVDIQDFTYEIENEESIICHITLIIEGLEKIEDSSEERECDGDFSEKEIEIPTIEEEKKEEIIETEQEMVVDQDEDDSEHLVFDFNEDDDSYGTFLVYIVRQNETVNTIIEKYHTTLEELEKYNDLNDISIGSKVIIPLNEESTN